MGLAAFTLCALLSKGAVLPLNSHTGLDTNEIRKKQIAIALSMVLANMAMAGPSNGNASVRAAEAHLKSQGARVNAAAEDGFAATDAMVDDNGDQHVRFDRSHRGLPVIGGDFVVHMNKGGNMKSASLTQRNKLNVDTTARVTALTRSR